MPCLSGFELYSRWVPLITAFTRWRISLQLDSLARTCKLVVSFFDKFSVFINELWVAFLIFSLVTVKPNLCVTTDAFARLGHQRQKPFIAFDVNIPCAGNIFIYWNIKEKTPEAVLTCLESYGLWCNILIYTIDVLYNYSLLRLRVPRFDSRSGDLLDLFSVVPSSNPQLRL